MEIVRLSIVALVAMSVFGLTSCNKIETDEPQLRVVFETTELESLTAESLIALPGTANHLGSTYPGGDASERTYTITNSTSRAFTLLGEEPVSIINGDFNDFRIIGQPETSTLQSEESVTFVVSFTPGGFGQRSSNIVFHYREGDDEVSNEDLPEQEMRAFYMTIGGTGASNGRLSLRSEVSNLAIPSDTDPSVELGTWFSGEGDSSGGGGELPSVQEGSEINRTFFISNESDAEVLNLLGSRVTLEGGSAFFSLEGPSVDVVNPGGVAQFTVKYRPTDPGSHNATLLITSSAINSPFTGYRVRLGARATRSTTIIVPPPTSQGEASAQEDGKKAGYLYDWVEEEQNTSKGVERNG